MTRPLVALGIALYFVLLKTPSAFAHDPTPQYKLSNQEVRALVYKPWYGPLLELKRNLKPDRNYVAWILVPPHQEMDMRSGNDFRHSYLATPPDDFAIGHNLIVWQCKRKDGSHSEGGMAITGENYDQSKVMTKMDWGLTSLFTDFTDGEIEGTDVVNEELVDETKIQGFATVAFEVSQDSCENMLDFVDAYTLDPARPFSHFSNLQDPDKFEGGGCVTLARALLKRAGIFTNVIPLFGRNFVVNRKLLGGNIPAPDHISVPEWPWLNGKPHRVPPLKLIATNWDGDDETGVPLTLMDPEVMLYSLRQLALAYLKTVPAEYRAQEENVFGRSPFGFRTVKSSVGPLYSVKKGYIAQHRLIPINDAYDPQLAEAGRQARLWLENAEQGGMQMRHMMVMKSPGIVIDKP